MWCWYWHIFFANKNRNGEATADIGSSRHMALILTVHEMDIIILNMTQIYTNKGKMRSNTEILEKSEKEAIKCCVSNYLNYN